MGDFAALSETSSILHRQTALYQFRFGFRLKENGKLL